MLLNISNHPSSLWNADQLNAASVYGETVDLPFPDVDPSADESVVSSLAEKYLELVVAKGTPEDVVVHLMGEFCFTYALLLLLRERGYLCVASTSRRNVVMEDGVKKVIFEFCAFRKYWED